MLVQELKRTPGEAMHPSLHGDLSVRVVVDTKRLTWSASPSGTVWRKRLHLVGEPEAGQVTSLVRYERNSHFPSHDHPEGEEILVLEGVFSDEHGDWRAGTYLLNPEGFRHAPHSREGCLLFVKLRQFPGKDRRHIVLDTETMAWHRLNSHSVKRLYEQDGYSDVVRLERWSPGSGQGERTHPHGVELFVLSGFFEDEYGAYDAHTWVRLPVGFRHSPKTAAGCELYVKEGGLAYLRGG
jgi:anti-sigma factor ChrR (cupin superfamily)